MIRSLRFVFPFIAIGTICHAADRCPRCSAEVLPTDTFCSNCRWRMSDDYPSAPPPSTYSPPPAYRQPIERPPEPIRESNSSSPGYVLNESFVTPLKLSIVGPIALPTDLLCSVYGLHLSVLGGQSHTMAGIGISGIGSNCEELDGLSVGIFNLSRLAAYGLQIGFMNLVTDGSLYGCQIGVLNFAGRDTCGVQLGVINCIGSGDNSRTLPILNMSF